MVRCKGYSHRAGRSTPPAAGEVRIKVDACGICGSDLHEYADGPHAIPTKTPHPLSRQSAPLVIGHEFTGTVLECGADVEGFSNGARVAVEPEYRCNACPACLRGEYNLCRFKGFAGLMGDGGMAEEVTLPAYMLYPLPDAISMRQAAVLEPAAVALHALRRGGLQLGETCVVTGAGPIGLLIVQLAAAAGARRIVVSDTSAARLELARKIGATECVNPVQTDLTDIIEDADISFEAVGSEAALNDAIRCVRRGGRVVLVGLFGAKPKVDLFALVTREIDLIASAGYRQVYDDLIQMVAGGQFDPSLIITKEVRLDTVVEDGFEALLSDKDNVKIIMTNGSGP